MSDSQKIIKVFTKKSTTKNLTFNLKQNEELNVILYIIANHSNVKYKINCKHKQNSKVNITCNCIANKNSNINVTFSSEVCSNDNNCVIKQQINGILMDVCSSITVLPSLIIGNNNIKAEHEVNIGGIDKKKLFYLMTRGIEEQNARKILINQLFNKAEENEYADLLI